MLSLRLIFSAILISFSTLAKAVPPVPDSDRYASFALSFSTTTINVPFNVYGDCTDVQVLYNGALLTLNSDYTCASASGVVISLQSLPITDMQITLTPPRSSGTIVVVGAWHPRNTTIPTAPGITRNEYEQSTNTIISGMRELNRAFIGSGASVGSAGISVGLSTITGGNTGSILIDNAGTLGGLSPSSYSLIAGNVAGNAWASIPSNLGVWTALQNTVDTPTGLLNYETTAPVSPIYGVLLSGGLGHGVLGTSSAGSAGQVLTSNGPSAAPTWQASGSGGSSLGGLSPSSYSLIMGNSAGTAWTTIPSNLGVWTALQNTLDTPTGLLNYQTGASVSPIYGVLLSGGSGNGVLGTSSAGTSGQVLTSNGASAAPTWNTLTGSITATPSNYSLLSGNGTAWVTLASNLGVWTALQNTLDTQSGLLNYDTTATVSPKYGVLLSGGSGYGVLGTAGVGTSGQVLTSNGGASAPTWATPSGGGVGSTRSTSSPTIVQADNNGVVYVTSGSVTLPSGLTSGTIVNIINSSTSAVNLVGSGATVNTMNGWLYLSTQYAGVTCFYNGSAWTCVGSLSPS